MSYARFGWDDSDLYVFSTSVDDKSALTCCGCILDDEDGITSFYAFNTKDMIDHVKKHKKVGHGVPTDLVDLLSDDDEVNFPKEDDDF